MKSGMNEQTASQGGTGQSESFAQVIMVRIRAMISSLVGGPHVGEGADARGRNRVRRVAATALASALAKVVSAGAFLVTIPLTLNYLGLERFGVWTVIGSFSMILSFADFGLGNGVLTAIARHYGHGNRAGMREVISNGYLILVGAATLMFTVLITVYPHVAWAKAFNLTSPVAAAEAGTAVLVYASCIALGIPIGLIRGIQNGLQQGFATSLWQGLASIIGVIALFAAIQLEAGLAVLVGILAGVPLLVSIANSTVFFARNRDLIPSPLLFDIRCGRKLAATGVLFLLMQISVAFAHGFDGLIITQLVGPAAVAQYAVHERVFALITVFIVMTTSPLWPAYGEAISAAEYAWVRRIFKRSLAISLGVAFVASFLLLTTGSELIGLWVGHAIVVSMPLMLALAVWRVVEAGGTAISMYLNGRGFLGRATVIALITAAATLITKVVLVGAFGAPAIPWSSALCCVVFFIVPTLWILRSDIVLSKTYS